MQTNMGFRLGAGLATILAPALAACGGGASSGGGGVVSAPLPAPAPTVIVPAAEPTPAAAPTPYPVSAVFDTPEFRQSGGPLQHNAAIAWSTGRSGSGVTIAVIDTGIDSDSPEFAGRISSASKDLTSAGRSLEGHDDHGTSVAMIAAAARNGTGILGTAFGATVLALRADQPGSCDTTAGNCSFSDDVLAHGVTYAVQNGAKVINLSLGGQDGAGPALRAAVNQAVGAGALVVVAAGNASQAEISAFAAQVSQAGSGGVLVVGSVNADGAISSFSNRAGTAAQNYLVARGENVCCSYADGALKVENGQMYLMSGTSFSTPQVSGAAALLAQAFPNLTGKQIAQILLDTAFDAGAAGADAVYGRGILDIGKAFLPIGMTSLAGGGALALSDGAGAGSAAMGDSLASASLQSVVLDSYGRAFATDLAGTLRSAAPTSRLGAAVGTQQRNVSFGTPQAAVAFTVDASGRHGETPRLQQLRLSNEDADQARVLAARVTTRLNPQLQLGFAYRNGADSLTAQLQDQDRAAFLIAPASGSADAGLGTPETAFALRRSLGAWGLTLFAEQGELLSNTSIRRLGERNDPRLSADVASMGAALDRRFGDLSASLGLSRLAEDKTLLGGRFHDAFGLSGADSTFIDVRAGWSFAPHWNLGAALRQGWSEARTGGQVAAGSHLESRSWSFDVARSSVFSKGDSIGFRIAQPLRVESGALNFSLPTAWDYATQSASYSVQGVALAPKGRELIGELAWQGRMLAGFGSVSLFYRRDPGHFASLPDDKGVAMRWNAKF